MTRTLDSTVTLERKKRGGQVGSIGARKLGCKTKVSRVPEYWDVEDIYGGLESMLALMDDAQNEIAEAIKRSRKGTLSNRYEKLAAYLYQMQGNFPRSFIRSVKGGAQ